MTLRALADTVLSNGAFAEHTQHAATADVLAYLPSPPQGVWQLGPFPLRAYALCIIAGIIVAVWWGERRWQERGGDKGTVLDVAVFAVPFGLIGGRLYHVATDWQKYFGPDGDPLDALKIYQGGLGIWGAVFFGAVGAWIGCRVYKVPLPALGDAIAPPILLAQAIGRLGNYFNQELYGRETDVPWGLQIFLRFDDAGQLDMMNGVSSGEVLKVVHPTFLYELLWNVFVVVLLVLIDRRYRIGHGRLFALYVAGYSFGRFFVELMRDDEATQIAGIRINSFTAALVFLAAIAYFLLATRGREAPGMLRPGGGPRPWPWQFGALREAGKPADTEAGSATAAADEQESDTAGESGAVSPPDDAETEPNDVGSATQGSTTATTTDSDHAAADPDMQAQDEPSDDVISDEIIGRKTTSAVSTADKC